MTNKPVKLPEAGQWPDKVAPWALLAGIVLSTLGFLMAFLYAGGPGIVLRAGVCVLLLRAFPGH